jgi:hypothetical protein
MHSRIQPTTKEDDEMNTCSAWVLAIGLTMVSVVVAVPTASADCLVNVLGGCGTGCVVNVLGNCDGPCLANAGVEDGCDACVVTTATCSESCGVALATSCEYCFVAVGATCGQCMVDVASSCASGEAAAADRVALALAAAGHAPGTQALVPDAGCTFSSWEPFLLGVGPTVVDCVVLVGGSTVAECVLSLDPVAAHCTP